MLYKVKLLRLFICYSAYTRQRGRYSAYTRQRGRYSAYTKDIEVVIQFIQKTERSLFSLYKRQRGRYSAYTKDREVVIQFIQKTERSLFSLYKRQRGLYSAYTKDRCCWISWCLVICTFILLFHVAQNSGDSCLLHSTSIYFVFCAFWWFHGEVFVVCWDYGQL